MMYTILNNWNLIEDCKLTALMLKQLALLNGIATEIIMRFVKQDKTQLQLSLCLDVDAVI